jgi:cytochrome c-type biogenesis protein CcmH
LIWLVIVAAVFVGGGAWLAARDWRTRGIVAAVGAAAVAGYWLIGKPDMRDAPLAGRLVEIEKIDPSSLNGAQLMALAQKRAQEEPQNPGPHLAIGVLMEMAGQPNEAMLAYESALRRDPNELEAIKRLANLRFQTSGTIDEATSALYHEWFAREPNELHIGFFAGMGDWLAGRKAEAQAIWADVEARTPTDDPRRQMYAALREQFGVDAGQQGQREVPKTPN